MGVCVNREEHGGRERWGGGGGVNREGVNGVYKTKIIYEK